MKLSKEQKGACKGIALYAVMNCFGLPLIHLFKATSLGMKPYRTLWQR